MGHQRSALVTVLDLLEIPDLLFEYFKEFMYIPVIAPYLEPVIHFLPRTIWAATSAMVGFDELLHIDLGELPMMARNDVGGTSTKNTMHWFQEIRSGNFAHFDYGTEVNQ